MAPSSPTVALLEFRLRIRKRRDELGISAEAVHKHLHVSRVYYSSIENGRAILSDAKLEPLLTMLEFDSQEASELAALLTASRERGWWSSYSHVMEPAFAEFVGLEHGASRLRIVENRVMTGLLQTRPYAEAVMRASPTVSVQDLSASVDIRLRRQARLDPPDPVRLELVISETVLLQQYGDSSILREQLKALLRRVNSETSTIELRIQPFHITPLGGTVSSTIVVLDFASTHIPAVAWRETSGSFGVVYDHAEVGADIVDFEQAKKSALDRVDSVNMVQERIASFG